MIEANAQRVARQASENLQRSREQLPQGVDAFAKPTWTGRFGTRGSPGTAEASQLVAGWKSVARASAPSSAELLQNIRERSTGISTRVKRGRSEYLKSRYA